MTATQTASTSSPVINFATAPPSQERTLAERQSALPFFRKGRGKVGASWWNVAPTGDYGRDITTGRAYARDFLPLMSFNAGAATLGWIVCDMAKNSDADRGIDTIALGFMMEIGSSLQSAIAGLAIAACAIEDPDSDLGPGLAALIKNGAVLRGMSRSTLNHEPGASIFDKATA